MAYLLGRSGLQSLYQVANQAIPGALGGLESMQVLRPLANKMLPSGHDALKMKNEPYSSTSTRWAIHQQIPKAGLLASSSFRAVSGIAARSAVQVRQAHTDIVVPDMSEHRRSASLDPRISGHESDMDRRLFSYLVTGSLGATGVWGGKEAVKLWGSMLQPGKDVVSAARIEVDLSGVPEGKQVTVKWRGKPLFVRHRTDAEISREAAVDVKSLRHPEHDGDRALEPRWLILVGICTHLGCVPLAGLGDFGGYYCPCHGSHYDVSGRIRRGPAPQNLEVPPYEFLSPTRIVVG